jgi:hypothetical protein
MIMGSRISSKYVESRIHPHPPRHYRESIPNRGDGFVHTGGGDMKTWRVVVIAIGVFGLLAGASPALAQGNAEATQACKDGGYLNWLDADGNPFLNQGQCVQYVAQGNTLYPVAPQPSLVVRQVQFGPGGTCQFWVEAYDFPQVTSFRFQVFGARIPIDQTIYGPFPSGQVVVGLGWPADGVTYHVYAVAHDAAGNHVATSPTQEVFCAAA